MRVLLVDDEEELVTALAERLSLLDQLMGNSFARFENQPNLSERFMAALGKGK